MQVDVQSHIWRVVCFLCVLFITVYSMLVQDLAYVCEYVCVYSTTLLMGTRAG